MKEKEEEVVTLMEERNLSILGVCETRLSGAGRKTIHHNYEMLWSGREDKMHGVGIIVSPDIANYIVNVDYKNERIMRITLQLTHIKISLYQVYAPQQGRANQEKEEFYQNLQQLVDQNPGTMLVMGDMNGHVGQDREGLEGILGAFGIGDRNREGERIIDFCILNNLSIMNTFYKHKDEHKWSWYRYNNTLQDYSDKTMIDLMLTNNKNIFKDVKAIPSVSLDSDHRMILGKIRIKLPVTKNNKKRKRFMLENLKNPQCIEQLITKVQDRRQREISETVSNVESKWNKFKEVVKTTAEEVIQLKISGNTKKKSTAWWTPEVANAVKEKMRAFRKWMKTRTQEDRQDYIEKRNQAETIKRTAKKETWQRIGEDLERDTEGTRKLLYTMARNYRKGNQEMSYAVKDESGELLMKQEDISERWRDYFEKLLNAEEANNEENVEQTQSQEEEEQEMEEISMEEVRGAVRRMKNGKAPGEDELPVEIIKILGETGISWLREIINEAWKAERIPQDWGRAIVCPIYKKGDKTQCNNYRGISLLSHVGKIYERILETRLRTQIENKLGEWQCGFRPNRSTTDLVFTLKIIMEKSWEWDKEKDILFVDMEKAFDRIPRERLWKVLSKDVYKVKPKLRRAIKSIYKNCESKVKLRNNDTNWFEIKTGVRQGGVLSPLLFIIFMDYCMKEIGRNYEEITLAYADDIAIICDSERELQCMAEKWDNKMKENKMKINTKKTEVLKLSRDNVPLNIMIAGERIKQVQNFQYLGVQINAENKHEVEINQRITKYNSNLMALYPILKDIHVPQKTKIIIYTTILRPILLYGSEVWTLTQKNKSKVQAAEMKVLRLIKGVTRRDRIRNEDIRRELGLIAVTEVVERNQLRWYGHLMRMGEERLPRQALEWIPQGRRPVGRPRKRWMEGVEESVRRRGETLGDVKRQELYMDRKRWRDFAGRAAVTDRL